MLSLAPFLYRNIGVEQGGPVEQIQSSRVPVFGTLTYQALAFLKPGLVDRKKMIMYGSADGMGDSENPSVAQHKAISEALERWALVETHRSGNTARYGFDIDRCSNGMAAFPGFSWQARRKANFEALERYALIGWWNGSFKAIVQASAYPNVSLVRIDHGRSDGEVVILFHKSRAGFVAYGHAADRTLNSAASRALVELARNEHVISRYRACGGLAAPTDYFERRCLHFSTEEGHAEFLQRLASGPTKTPPRWKTIFNGEIPGPWSKWATVWRHCVEMPTYDFLNREENFFFW